MAVTEVQTRGKQTRLTWDSVLLFTGAAEELPEVSLGNSRQVDEDFRLTPQSHHYSPILLVCHLMNELLKT